MSAPISTRAAPAPDPDAELERAAMSGDRAAFSQVVRLHQRSVFFTALRMGRGDEQFARDISQKTFLQAWSKRSSFRGESSLKTWLLRITTNLALNELRRAWRHREVVPDDDSGETPLGTVEARAFDALATSEARGLLREAVETLSPRQRAVAVLRIYEDLSFADIAASCGITTNNAKVNFHHAVRNIQRSLAAAGVA